MDVGIRYTSLNFASYNLKIREQKKG